MHKAAITLAAFCVVIAGCKTPGTEPQVKTLLARTDQIVGRESLAEQSFIRPAPPNTEEGQFHIKTTWYPGEISFTPILLHEYGRGNTTLKGLQIYVRAQTYAIDEKMEPAESSTCLLDVDEGKDLVRAMDTLMQTYGEWSRQHPPYYRDVAFASKDGFRAAVLTSHEQEPRLQSLCHEASIDLKLEQMQQVQEKLKAAIASLDGR
jgi:hypothetical protein